MDPYTYNISVHIAIRLGRTLVDAKREEIARDEEEGVEPTGFLSNVIATHQLEPGEIYSSVSELMTAAVDTVSDYSYNSKIIKRVSRLLFLKWMYWMWYFSDFKYNAANLV